MFRFYVPDLEQTSATVVEAHGVLLVLQRSTQLLEPGEKKADKENAHFPDALKKMRLTGPGVALKPQL